MKVLVYLIGPPGSGKSTLMRELTERWDRVPAESGLARELLLCPRTAAVEAVELGRRRAEFSGTDAMGQAVINAAIYWLATQTETDLVFGEGTRLGNRRFLLAARDAGYEVLLGHLSHPMVTAWRLARESRTGKAQNPSWVAGRDTAARNLAAEPPAGVSVVIGHPDTLRAEIERYLHERRR